MRHTAESLREVYEEIFQAIRDVRGEGQLEYARRSSRPFANFERIGERLGLSREKVLSVYLEKHLDGIHAHIDGHTSQREEVSGRILDAINYLMLLEGMLRETPEDEEVLEASPPNHRVFLDPFDSQLCGFV